MVKPGQSRERQKQQECLEQATMRDGWNRGTHLDLNKLLSNSPYNTFLTFGNDGAGLEKSENQEPEGAMNKDVALR